MTPDGACRTCKAPIVWARTRTGMAIPLDPEPVPNGNVEVAGPAGEVAASYVQAEPDVVRYVSHFATCPDAGQHRRTVRSKR